MPLSAAGCCVCVHFFQSIWFIFDNFPRFPPISLKLLSLNIFFQIVSLFEAGPLLPTWLGEGIELAGNNTKKGSREVIFIRWLHVTSECLQMRSMICYSSSCLFHCSTKLRVRKLKCSGQSSDLKADSNTFDVTTILCCYVMNLRIVRMFLLSISPSSRVWDLKRRRQPTVRPVKLTTLTLSSNVQYEENAHSIYKCKSVIRNKNK